MLEKRTSNTEITESAESKGSDLKKISMPDLSKEELLSVKMTPAEPSVSLKVVNYTTYQDVVATIQEVISGREGSRVVILTNSSAESIVFARHLCCQSQILFGDVIGTISTNENCTCDRTEVLFMTKRYFLINHLGFFVDGRTTKVVLLPVLNDQVYLDTYLELAMTSLEASAMTRTSKPTKSKIEIVKFKKQKIQNLARSDRSIDCVSDYLHVDFQMYFLKTSKASVSGLLEFQIVNSILKESTSSIAVVMHSRSSALQLESRVAAILHVIHKNKLLQFVSLFHVTSKSQNVKSIFAAKTHGQVTIYLLPLKKLNLLNFVKPELIIFAKDDIPVEGPDATVIDPDHESQLSMSDFASKSVRAIYSYNGLRFSRHQMVSEKSLVKDLRLICLIDNFYKLHLFKNIIVSQESYRLFKKVEQSLVSHKLVCASNTVQRLGVQSLLVPLDPLLSSIIMSLSDKQILQSVLCIVSFMKSLKNTALQNDFLTFIFEKEGWMVQNSAKMMQSPQHFLKTRLKVSLDRELGVIEKTFKENLKVLSNAIQVISPRGLPEPHPRMNCNQAERLLRSFYISVGFPMNAPKAAPLKY